MTPHGEDELYEESQRAVVMDEGEAFFGRGRLWAIIGIVILLNFGVMLFVRSRMKA